MARRGRPGRRDQEVAELYAVPLDEFVAARDALAKRLRDQGEGERSSEVKRLRKPSRSAWALNQGARESPQALSRLLRAGERLEAAQQEALSGGDREKLRDAMSAHGDAVEEMVGAVDDAVGKEVALSAAALDRVRETLRAAAGDPQLREELAAARVARDRQAVGFGATGGPTSGTPSSPRRRKQGTTQAQRRKAEQRVKRAQRDLDAATKALTQARSRLDRAQRDAARAKAQVKEAEARLDDSETERDDARAALEELKA